MNKMKPRLDHLILGIEDLDRGIEWLRNKTGVTAARGGSHPGMGTRNALLSLGKSQYLEIMSLDPKQKRPGWMAALIRGLQTPQLVAWAAAVPDIHTIESAAKREGYECEGPADGSRTKPDGSTLSWRLLRVRGDYGNAIPFFIEWISISGHPSSDAPLGCRLEDMEIYHPQADQVREMLRRLGIAVAVQKDANARLRAVLATPNGKVALE